MRLRMLLLLSFFLATIQGVTAHTSMASVISFSNSDQITIPESDSFGQATPYPSSIEVAGVTEEVTQVTIVLTGLSHTCLPDVDVLLEGPGGQNVLLMSDNGICFGSISDVSLTFDDTAANPLPEAGEADIVSGVFRPSNSNPDDDSADSFAPPGPSAPFGTALSVFNGIDPNARWELFVMDDTEGDIGSISQGWTLNLHVVPEPTSLLMIVLGLVSLLLHGRRIRRRFP